MDEFTLCISLVKRFTRHTGAGFGKVEKWEVEETGDVGMAIVDVWKASG